MYRDAYVDAYMIIYGNVGVCMLMCMICHQWISDSNVFDGCSIGIRLIFDGCSIDFAWNPMDLRSILDRFSIFSGWMFDRRSVGIR